MSKSTRILIATSNPGKRDEFQALTAELLDLPIEWLTPADIGLAELDVEETGDTFIANALLKAFAYLKYANLPVLADDSGLEVDALNGAPGVYSARYAPTVAERNAKLLNALHDVPPAQRTARFHAALVIAFPTGLTLIGEGQLEGHIGDAPRGTGGHGYDPVVVLPDGRTVAELSAKEKNIVSHRGKAFSVLLPVLRSAIG